MEAIKTAAQAVCAGLIALGVIGVLVPDGRNRGLIRTVFAVFTLLCVVTPVYKAIREVDLSDTRAAAPSDSELARAAARRTAELSAEIVSAEAERLLSSAGFPGCEISPDMDIDDAGGISIKRITVSGAEGYDPDTIRGVLTAGFGVPPDAVEVKENG